MLGVGTFQVFQGVGVFVSKSSRYLGVDHYPNHYDTRAELEKRKERQRGEVSFGVIIY